VSRHKRRLIHLANLLVGGTGVVYAWMLYVLEPSDPFSVLHHPWQPAVQHLHVWAAPLMVFAVGLIWQNHIWKHWKRQVPERRTSGVLMLIVAFFPMVFSGYFLQTAVNESWRQVWLVVHLATGGLWILAYAGHLLGPDRRRREARERETPVSERPARRGATAPPTTAGSGS
jgi:hypothetical protein